MAVTLFQTDNLSVFTHSIVHIAEAVTGWGIHTRIQNPNYSQERGFCM